MHVGPIGSFGSGSVMRDVNAPDSIIPEYGTPRAMTASGERLDVRAAMTKAAKRTATEWQTRSWQYFESIGEVNYGLGQIGSIISRVRLYAGVVERPDKPPVPAADVLTELQSAGLDPNVTKFVLEEAQRLVTDLLVSAPGIMRELTINLSVAGEAYLANVEGGWFVASSDGLTPTSNGYRLRTDRAQMSGEQVIPEDAYVARIWRSNPRFVKEPDSSMIGVLDACDLRLLIDQAIRAMLRRRLNAGVIAVPNGLQALVVGEAGSVTVADALARMAIEPVADETAAYSVVPLVVTGDPELLDKLKRIVFTEPVDESLVALGDRTIERILQGLEIPKELVTGVANLRYSNAIVLDDNIFKRSVEPMVLLIVDALTSAYLRPLLRAAILEKNGVTSEEQSIVALTKYDELLKKIVIWFDPSAVVTRPDKSTAADTGYAQHILSAASWRAARGFGDVDAPSEEELRMRMTIEKAPIPPDMASAMIAGIDPTFWKQSRAAAAAATEQPAELQQLLNPDEAAPPVPPSTEPTGNSETANAKMSGGEVSENGFTAPQPRV
jgi:hypothetical protein